MFVGLLFMDSCHGGFLRCGWFITELLLRLSIATVIMNFGVSTFCTQFRCPVYHISVCDTLYYTCEEPSKDMRIRVGDFYHVFMLETSIGQVL